MIVIIETQDPEYEPAKKRERDREKERKRKKERTAERAKKSISEQSVITQLS